MILNDLMEGLGKKTLGEDSFNIVQDNIIGAHQLDPPPGENTPITRITLDSRHTKSSIRWAAEKSGRWGNGTHSLFFRDITLDQRKRKTSKSEDTYVPRKDNYQDTPKKGGDPKGKRLAPFGFESKKEERSRTVWERQAEIDKYERQRIQIKKDQELQRIAKREHQRREEEEAQEKANRQHHAGPSHSHVSPVQQFRAVNEENLQEADPQGTPVNAGDPEGSARSTMSETDESIEVFPKDKGDNEARPQDTDSEEEYLRDNDQEYELDPEYQSSEEEVRDPSPSPEREVTFTPSTSKNARRNSRRRKRLKLQQTQAQYEENKKKIDI